MRQVTSLYQLCIWQLHHRFLCRLSKNYRVQQTQGQRKILYLLQPLQVSNIMLGVIAACTTGLRTRNGLIRLPRGVWGCAGPYNVKL